MSSRVNPTKSTDIYEKIPLLRRAFGYAAAAEGAPLEPFAFDLGALQDDEVIVRVSHCGVCMSDVDILNNKYGRSEYPVVLGHELVGRVEAVGPAVTHLAPGDRVGVGPVRRACGACAACQAGDDLFCPSLQLTAEPGGRGGLADRMRICARFAFPIPDALTAAEAAPLLCAGLTTYTPLKAWRRPGDRVGVLGVGGLGHLAVQFARRMGHAVTTFAIAPDAAERARHQALGADTVVDLGDDAAVAAAAGSIDLLLSTIYGDVDWSRLMRLLRPHGRLCLVGAAESRLSLNPLQLIHGAKAVAGSGGGSHADMVAMLAFAAREGVRPRIETLPLARVNEAFAAVQAGTVRYRMVVETNAATGAA